MVSVLSNAQSGTSVLVDVRKSEEALNSALFRHTNTVEWARKVVETTVPEAETRPQVVVVLFCMLKFTHSLLAVVHRRALH